VETLQQIVRDASRPEGNCNRPG